ncbi:MAG: DUF5615 family PIN-like protein [Cyclobacteriaceae bacterium]|nr:DUF5615 family PIN-like protein [Cyclobacteriaceae bacterium]MCX7638348.1 DUF5615 family PIN-like protein [Cyclobacteriaceae bacterium]MDW8331143.1 DUF5615 family PIN-like protein [Cyclobacteriaceae bacterium]
MKLLFDENISYRIIKKVQELFPGSIHISSVDTRIVKDVSIFEYARKHGFIIVTFDEDFRELQSLLGCPPKIIWLRTGNTSTQNILKILNKKRDEIQDFFSDDDLGILEIH